MTLSLLANKLLRPYLEQLTPLCPNQLDVTYLSEQPAQRQAQIARHLQSTVGYDAVVLLEGTDLIPEEGWQVGATSLVMPDVHNVAALLLGGADAYRRLFERCGGGVCWMFPGARQELHAGHPDDCQTLCLVTDTQFALPDTTLYAQTIAHYHGWDFIRTPSELSLLESLLCGGWQCADFINVPAGGHLMPREMLVGTKA